MGYDAQRATALTLIRRFGASATITQVTLGAIDLSTDAATRATSTMSCSAVLIAASARNDTFEQATRIRTKNRQAYVAASQWPFTPGPGDTLTFAGQTFTILGVGLLDPDGSGTILATMDVEREGTN